MARRKTKAERARISRSMKALHAAKRAAREARHGTEVALIDEAEIVSLGTAPGYSTLQNELHAAFVQSAHGKGKERHANGRPFDRQPIMELGRLYGPGFSAGQAAKKAQEALGMASRGERDKAIFEIHGAMVYLAATAALLREGGE